MSDTPRTDKWYSHYRKHAVPILMELPVEKRVLYTTAVAMAADTSANLEREVAALREKELDVLVTELCHQLGAKDGANMAAMLFLAVEDALRYRYLREHWDDFTGLTSRKPLEWLDAAIDTALKKASP